MPPIQEITLQLFIYDLQEGLGQTEETVQFNRYYFWRRLNDNLQKPYQQLTADDRDRLDTYAKRENSESDICLLDSQDKTDTISGIDYELAASQLGDTYSLIVDTYVSDPQTVALRKLKDSIHQQIRNTPATLGQTWLLWTQLDRKYSPDKISQTIAKDCYIEIASQPRSWEKDGELKFPANRLLDGQLFEISQTLQLSDWENLIRFIDSEKPPTLQKYPQLDAEHQSHLNELIEKSAIGETHYVIWLLPPNPTLPELQAKIRDIQTHFHRLFCYRHKIIWAYAQSRILKRRLKDNYQTIQKSVLTIRQQGKNPAQLQETLEETLEILGNYAIDLSQLHSQLRTITINLENYQERLGKFAEVDPDCELNSFAKFGQLAEKKYQRQVEADYESLSPGMILLENLITTIEGIVEINQAKRERRLERAIAAASIGVGTASVASTSVANQAKEIFQQIAATPTETQSDPPPIISPALTTFLVFFAGCAIGLLCGGVTWWGLNRNPKKPE